MTPGRHSRACFKLICLAKAVAANAVEAKWQAAWDSIKEEQGRRAVLLADQERSIAKLSERCKSLELKNRMLTAKQEQTAKAAAEAFDAAGGQEMRNDAGPLIYSPTASLLWAACSSRAQHQCSTLMQNCPFLPV